MWERNGLARMAKKRAKGQEMDTENTKIGAYSKLCKKEISDKRNKKDRSGRNR